MKRLHLRTLGLLAAAASLAAPLGATGCSSGNGGTIVFDISGEVLSTSGYPFPPASMNDTVFVDGWEVQFSHLLVTVDKITLSENPDLSPTDESQIGALVAEVDGPWVVDLHKGGPLQGKGSPTEQAVELTRLDNQNQNGGAPFDPTVRYAFGFEVVHATASAKNVNLDAQGMADYALMQQNKYTVLYVGTATFKGKSCTPDASTPEGAEFARFPTVVDFKLGFASPTSYANCQNPDNDPATPLGREEHERGIVVANNGSVTAQLTIHTDHPFWESFVHDSPAHFDMLAARHTGAKGTPTVVLEDLRGVDPTAITDAQGNPVPWRTCDSFYTPPSAGQMSFDTLGIPINPEASGDKLAFTIRDLYDFVTYNQSTQGHLNSDGLCFVDRRYTSPR